MHVKKTAFDQIFDHWLQKDSGHVNSRFWANEPNSSDLSRCTNGLAVLPLETMSRECGDLIAAADLKNFLTDWNRCSRCEEAWTLMEMYHVRQDHQT